MSWFLVSWLVGWLVGWFRVSGDSRGGKDGRTEDRGQKTEDYP